MVGPRAYFPTPRLFTSIRCIVCGEMFLAGGATLVRARPSQLKCCSDECSRKKMAAYRRSRYRERYRLLAAASDVTVADEIAMRRKAKSCPLCGCQMTEEAGPRQKQLDHIEPVCVGGTHTHGNVRIICRTCNLERPKDGSDLVDFQTTLWATDALAVPSRPPKPKSKMALRAERGEAKRALARLRAERALEMRQTGTGWQVIAEELGYANPSGPYLAIKQTLGLDPRSLVGFSHVRSRR